MTHKEVEAKIRRAFEIDKVLPFPRPKSAECLLGRLVVIPNTERSFEDIAEDAKYIITQEDWDLWHEVMFEWMPKLHGVQRAVVKYRCCGMGWKRIAKMLYDKEFTHRTLDRSTLWRIFAHGLDEFCAKS